ncbi:MAG TPA: sulfatase-like hydrolase/transferase, partial [Bacillota bacterium]|nr:sulfatase-like hydrolase/transferase [Bacillota bacterium]
MMYKIKCKTKAHRAHEHAGVSFYALGRTCALLASLAVLCLHGNVSRAASNGPTNPPPNILFAIADDWGVHAGAYGTKWVKTPAFDRVAHDGILFRNAYTPNAKCAPSRACILTGRNSWQLKAAANHVCYFPPEFKGWGEALAEHGWFVG